MGEGITSWEKTSTLSSDLAYCFVKVDDEHITYNCVEIDQREHTVRIIQRKKSKTVSKNNERSEITFTLKELEFIEKKTREIPKDKKERLIAICVLVTIAMVLITIALLPFC